MARWLIEKSRELGGWIIEDGRACGDWDVFEIVEDDRWGEGLVRRASLPTHKAALTFVELRALLERNPA